MGLRDVVRNAAQTALNAVGDLAVSANYLAYGSTTYDPSAGVDVVTFTSYEGVKVLFGEFSLFQVDGERVLPGDRRAFIAGKAISGVTPGPHDRIIVDGSVAWHVAPATPPMDHQAARIAADPADGLFDIHVRRA